MPMHSTLLSSPMKRVCIPRHIPYYTYTYIHTIYKYKYITIIYRKKSKEKRKEKATTHNLFVQPPPPHLL